MNPLRGAWTAPQNGKNYISAMMFDEAVIAVYVDTDMTGHLIFLTLAGIANFITHFT
jgi:hypothetical protein